MSTMSLRISFRCLRIAASALLDHPLDHRDGEGHARRLDRLEVDGGEQPWLRGVAFIGRRVGENVFERAGARSPDAARKLAAGSAVSQRSRMVGNAALMSNTPPARTASSPPVKLPVASLIQPIAYGPTKPARLPIELMMAMPAAAAAPERNGGRQRPEHRQVGEHAEAGRR